MQDYLTWEHREMFKQVDGLIYVFDVTNTDEEDLEYFRKINELTVKNSDDPHIFLLIHKVDLVEKDKNEQVMNEAIEAITSQLLEDQELPLFFTTTIFDSSLYVVSQANTLTLTITTLTSFLGLVRDCPDTDTKFTNDWPNAWRMWEDRNMQWAGAILNQNILNLGVLYSGLNTRWGSTEVSENELYLQELRSIFPRKVPPPNNQNIIFTAWAVKLRK